MKEKTLLTVAVLMAIMGLTGLTLFDADEQSQKITGRVGKIINSDTVTIAYVWSSLPVVFFEKQELEKGQNITIYGNLATYQGKIEFIGKKWNSSRQ